MADKFHDLGNGFYNIQGTFRLGGILDIGTQCSLVRLASGKFIFLDSYTLTNDVREHVMAITNQGNDVEAVLNLHPFHTLHCMRMVADFPQATFYGSIRHQQKVPSVAWASDWVESDAVAQRYPELEFTVPQGIHYISPNENIHASSVLAYHPVSQSLHVDDTFVTPPTKLLKALLPELTIHPTTKYALTNEPNAGKQYCDWATDLAQQWRDVRHFCAAHSGVIHFKAGEFQQTLLSAIEKARPKLQG